jgi:hypothetical protein
MDPAAFAPYPAPHQGSAPGVFRPQQFNGGGQRQQRIQNNAGPGQNLPQVKTKFLKQIDLFTFLWQSQRKLTFSGSGCFFLIVDNLNYYGLMRTLGSR